jgi:hypothetical protein
MRVDSTCRGIWTATQTYHVGHVPALGRHARSAPHFTPHRQSSSVQFWVAAPLPKQLQMSVLVPFPLPEFRVLARVM